MAAPKDGAEVLAERRAEIKARVSALGDFRQGSLVERYRRCGKPSCHCAAEGVAGHGPSWSLTRAVDGKTVTRVIPAGPAVERTREQVAEYKKFRELTRQLLEVNEQICDARFESPEQSEAASKEAAKKRGLKRRSRPRSAPRSKHS